jgi:topoisomerase-4 subunit B
MTQSSYNADAIEVLTGLEPVRRRPGMYTDTTRPNHMGQEVIDNSVDEALAGHAKRVEVILMPISHWKLSMTAAACPSTFTRKRGASD